MDADSSAARWLRRAAHDIDDGLDEGYRLLGPVGFVSVAVLFVLVLAVVAR